MSITMDNVDQLALLDEYGRVKWQSLERIASQVKELKQELEETSPVKRWPKKNSLRLAICCMDMLWLCWFVVIIFGLSWTISTMKENRAVTTMAVLQFLVVLLVLAGVEMLYTSWWNVRDLALIYWHDKVPSEAEILLLEWDRNWSYDTLMPYIRYAAAITVVEKARKAETAGNAYTSFDDSIESADSVTGKLRKLLLANNLENPQEEQSDQEYKYNHHQWAYKSLWPTNYSWSFVAFLLLDSFWTTTSGFPFLWIWIQAYFIIVILLVTPIGFNPEEDEEILVEDAWSMVGSVYCIVRLGQICFVEFWWVQEKQQKGLRHRCLLQYNH